ncbi:MAG: hypothetical protein ABEJ28_02270 [Salinigranum sp.]
MRRRRYLLCLGAGLTGCVSRGPASTPTRSRTTTPSDARTADPTTTPSGTRTAVASDRRTLESNEPYRTAAGWRVRVTVFRARRGLVAVGDPRDEPVVPADRQFLEVGVETRGDGAPPPEDLCLSAAVDGEYPFEDCPVRIEAVDPDRLGTVQALPVPLEFGGAGAAVVWRRTDGPNVRWGVSDRTLAALRRPPAFVVEDVAVPDVAAEGETFDVEVTLHNAGRRADWFVAELGVASASGGRAVELACGAGETLTKTRELTARFGGNEALTVRLDWGLDAIERRVERA